MNDKTFIIVASIVSVGIMVPFWGIYAYGEYRERIRIKKDKEEKNRSVGGKTKRKKGKRQTSRK